MSPSKETRLSLFISTKMPRRRGIAVSPFNQRLDCGGVTSASRANAATMPAVRPPIATEELIRSASTIVALVEVASLLEVAMGANLVK